MFKPYKDNPNYLIFDDGRVYSLYRNRFLKPRQTEDGYLQVRMTVNSKSRLFRIHRLVAEMFIPNPNNLETVNHKDEDKTNNCVNNLEWMSKIDNLNYGTGRQRSGIAKQGSKNGRAKPVAQYTKDNELIRVYPSGADAAKALRNYPQGIKGINACAMGRLHTAYGFIWRFV